MAEPTKLVSNRKPPNAGKGRPKGVGNHLTRDLKAMILGALEDAGGQAYLTRQAEEKPQAFLALIGKVLPLQVQGDPTAPLSITVKWDTEA